MHMAYMRYHRPVTGVAWRVVAFLTVVFSLLAPGRGDTGDIPPNPDYRHPVTITLVEKAQLSPLMTVTGLSGRGDSSVASDRLALSDRSTVKIYSLRTGAMIWSRSFPEKEENPGGSSWMPVIPCRLSPDGRKLALLFYQGGRVEVIDIDAGTSVSYAVPIPSLIEWSDRGDYLMALGNRQELYLFTPGKPGKTRRHTLVPPGGVPPEYSIDYEVAAIHLMPDDRTFYFMAVFTISSGIYGMDLRDGKVRTLDQGEAISFRFSSTSQYLRQMTWEHPGDGWIRIGTVTIAGAEKLRSRDFVSLYTGRPAGAFAAMGPWCAFDCDLVRTPGKEEVPSSLELLHLPTSRVFRILTSSSDEVYRLHFSWYRQLLVMDLNAVEGRAVTVIDPAALLKGK